MTTPAVTRRRFLGGAASAAVLHPLAGRSQDAPAVPRRIKLGLVGGGGRGAWIAGLFQQHGGYHFHAVADYFQPAMEQLLIDTRRLEVNLEGLKS